MKILRGGIYIAEGDAREVGHTISDASQHLVSITCINLFSTNIKFVMIGDPTDCSVRTRGS